VGILTVQDVPLTNAEFRRISELVREHCGINLHEGKKNLVRSRLAKHVRRGNFSSFNEYIDHVLQDETGVEFSILVDALTTNLTSFFREPQHFQFLQQRFLPVLLSRRRQEGRLQLRGWSAGCSSGEEPYTIAITILESLQNSEQWDVKILATDIATTALETAKAGIYEAEKVAAVPPMLRQKYLLWRREAGRKLYQVSPKLKQLVIFAYLNLTDDWPIHRQLDFIFCRNVMIYFDKRTQARLVSRFWNLLNPGGVLFTGHSESLTGIDHSFEYIQPTIYMKPIG